MSDAANLDAIAYAQTRGGRAVLRAAMRLEEFEKRWAPLIPQGQRLQFTMQLGDLVQEARLAGQKE